MNILENLIFTDEKPATLLIRNSEKSQIIAIGLREKQILRKHVTTVPATLVVFKGEISFEIEEKILSLSAFATFDIPVNIPHEVTALRESVFLIIKEKN